jgi:hypothetical protein
MGRRLFEMGCLLVLHHGAIVELPKYNQRLSSPLLARNGSPDSIYIAAGMQEDKKARQFFLSYSSKLMTARSESLNY